MSTHDDITRWEVMSRLMECYKAKASSGGGTGRRHAQVRSVSSTSDSTLAMMKALVVELRDHTVWPRSSERERPKIRAGGYIILSRPTSAGTTTKAGRYAAQKVVRHQKVFDMATAIMEQVDPLYAPTWTAIACTKHFTGSPHIDHDNVGPFYGLSLGDFTGGSICVECDAMGVMEVDTRYRPCKVDGRNPHWVAPYVGDRYSVIYYATWGEAVAKTDEAAFDFEVVQ